MTKASPLDPTRARADAPADGAGRSEWANGWLPTVTAMLGTACAGIHVYTLGAMVAPIEAELGWTRTEITSGLLAYSIATVCFLPMIGYLLDRFGPRKIALSGIALYCGAVALLAAAGGSHASWLFVWLLIGFAGCFIKPVLWVSVVSRLFDRRRGIALAVVLCGGGLSSVALPVVIDWLTRTGGWRFAYVVVAAVAATVMLPLIFVVIRGRIAQPGRARHDAAPGTMLPGLTVRQAFRSTRYLRLACAAVMFSVVTFGMLVNFIPIAVDKGLERDFALKAAGLIGIGSIAGRLITGYLFDRFYGPLIAACSFLIPIVGVLLLLNFDGNHVLALAIALIMGFSLGAEHDCMSYLATRYFGLRNFGVIFSVIVALLVAGEGLGPLLASLAYDQLGSYDAFLWGALGLLVISSMLMATMGRYPAFTDDLPDQDGSTFSPGGGQSRETGQ